MPDDRRLVADVLARSPGAFATLVERYQKLVWHVVYRVVQDAGVTRDLAQEAFLRVFRQVDRFKFESSLGTWIGSVAFSVASRHLRRRRLQYDDADVGELSLEHGGGDFDLAEACANAQLLAGMHAAIARLPPVQRVVLTLHHLDEIGIGEIAAITGMPEGTVKSHLFRARLRLRRTLESLQGTPP